MIPRLGVTRENEEAVCWVRGIGKAATSFSMTARWFPIAILAIAMLTALPGGTPATLAAESIPWSTYTDRNCGIELTYPASYQLNSSGAKDFCALSLLIGVKEARPVRWLLSLQVTDMNEAYRQAMMDSGLQPSPSNFALYLAALHCQADGPEGSTYCTDGRIRTRFKTPQGLEGYEIYLTEVHESFAQRKIEKRTKGPIFAVDMSNDEAIWILLAEGSEDHLATLRRILDSLRVWGKARRQMPQVAELRRFSLSGQSFDIRITSTQLTGPREGPPRPPTNLFLLDPRGHWLGLDPGTTALHSEIPAITYSGWGESGVGLREVVEGRYQIAVTGTVANVPYKLAVQAPDQTGKLWTATLTSRTSEPGAIDRYELVYSRTSAPAVTLSEVRDLSEIRLLLYGAGDGMSELLVTDPQGRKTGRDPPSKLEYRTIPRSSYLNEGSQERAMVLYIRQPIEGSYVLQVSGTNAGNYSLDIRARDWEGAAAARPEFRNMPTARDAVHRYRLEYKATPKSSFNIAGAFDGSGEKPGEINGFLTYANPIRSEIRLEPGIARFPLLIFYGPSIQPTTFNAMLNGSNISGRFTPAPDKHELLWVPLRPGSNTLVMTVQGVTASGRTAKDTDELVFWVE